jgi:hypothetical protein
MIRLASAFQRTLVQALKEGDHHHYDCDLVHALAVQTGMVRTIGTLVALELRLRGEDQRPRPIPVAAVEERKA